MLQSLGLLRQAGSRHDRPGCIRRQHEPEAVFFAAVAVLLPLTAAAQDAHTTKWVNLRAGPGRHYPLVASFGPGTLLAVQGCIQGFAYGASIGFPIVTFEIGSYWGQYYTNWPWFGSQGHWAHHRPPTPPRPGIRPPGPGRPVVRPPVAPPGVRPPGEHPPLPGGRQPDVRSPEGGWPPGGGPGRPVGEERPQPR
jgi:uncharacterized protein YraI